VENLCLEFLANFYPEVALANYATPNKDWKAMQLVSPKESMPGLLNSIKAETEEETYSAVSKIISDFKVHMNVIITTKFIGFPRIYRRQNGVVNCLERPKWEQPRNLCRIYSHTCMTYR
jgi:hypothetical protein